MAPKHFPQAHQLSHKLTLYWVQPFPFSSIIFQIAYHIGQPAKYGHIQLVFHNSYFYPHLGPFPALQPPPFLLDNIAAKEYEVGENKDSNLDHFGIKYLVKWVDYPIFKYSHELDSHFDNALHILCRFLPHCGY